MRKHLPDVLWILAVCAIAIAALMLVAGCSVDKGFLGTGIGATAPPVVPPQPDGFAQIHWIAYAGGFLMLVGGAAMFWFGQAKTGIGLAVTGLCTIALALAAAYYGRTLALASMLTLGTGILAAFGYMAWYAWKYHRKDEAFKEVVTKANGQLEALSLSAATVAAVDRAKAKIAKE